MARTRFPRPKLSSTARGYGVEHRRLRAHWQTIVATGTVTCAKCRLTIPPGTPWHLGHTDDRQGYTGPEHAACNVKDGARRGNARSRGIPDTRRTSRTWW